MIAELEALVHADERDHASGYPAGSAAYIALRRRDALRRDQVRAVGPGLHKARWLAAAAQDRSLMYDGRPQRYGTQYAPDGRRQRLWDVDPTTTDAERSEWQVPPLAEQLRKADEATRAGAPVSVGSNAPEWLTDAIVRWYPPS